MNDKPEKDLVSSDGKHYWLTPPNLMRELTKEFKFNFDACPHPRPPGFDGLTAEWGSSTYVNPPFTGPTRSVRKALTEWRKGKRVVFVFPVPKWVMMLLAAAAKVRNLGDVRWCSVEDGKPGKGIGQHIAYFVLEPERKCRVCGCTDSDCSGCEVQGLVLRVVAARLEAHARRGADQVRPGTRGGEF